jgi:hypothetical protein
VGSVAEEPGFLLRATSKWDMQKKDAWAAELWQDCGLPSVSNYLAERKPYFDWDGLRRWVAAGHSVGLHTHTHPYCSNLRPEDIEAEILGPARMLEDKLGVKDLSLSYPFGDRLPATIEATLDRDGVFRSFLGIKGFVRSGTPRVALERTGIESANIDWAIFAPRVWPALNKAGSSSAS